MKNKKIIEVCDCDYVVSKLNKEEILNWYKKEFNAKALTLSDLHECDLDKEGMLWGSLEDYISFREAINRLSEYRAFTVPFVIASVEYWI